MSLRILIGFEKAGARGRARLVYVGGSGSELETARAGDEVSACHLLLHNPPGVRKNNPRHVPGAVWPGDGAVDPGQGVKESTGEEVGAVPGPGAGPGPELLPVAAEGGGKRRKG